MKEGERTGSPIEILVWQARAHQALGGIPAFLCRWQSCIRMFLEEDPPLTQLLREAASCEITLNDTGKLLRASKDEGHRSTRFSQRLIERGGRKSVIDRCYLLGQMAEMHPSTLYPPSIPVKQLKPIRSSGRKLKHDSLYFELDPLQKKNL